MECDRYMRVWLICAIDLDLLMIKCEYEMNVFSDVISLVPCLR